MVVFYHDHILFVQDRCQVGIVREVLRGAAGVVGAGQPRVLANLRFRAVVSLRECRHDPITEVIIITLIPGLIR